MPCSDRGRCAEGLPRGRQCSREGGSADRAAAIAKLVRRSGGSTYQYIVATRDHHCAPRSHFSGSPDFENSFPVHCVAGNEGSHFHPDFAPVTASGHVGEVFLKGAYSASKSGLEGFTSDGTSFVGWLNARQVTAVDIVGIATDHCVKATALDAVRSGFAARVLLDYTAGVAADSTRHPLGELRQAGVLLTGSPVVLG